jgi:hypothetical protein
MGYPAAGMQPQDGTAFNRTLLRRFVNMIGLYPVGTLMRLDTDELGGVTREQPVDPFRRQVGLVRDEHGHPYERDLLANPWERGSPGKFPLAIVEAFDAEEAGIDPLVYPENVGDRYH